MAKENQSIKMWKRGFFTGIIAGEGSFSIKISKQKSSKLGIRITPVFSITMSQDNTQMIQNLKESIGHGGLYEYRKSKEGHSRMLKFSIESIEGCKDIISFIEQHSDTELFRGTERFESYIVWKECVNMIDNKEHTTKGGAKKIAELRRDINSSQRSRDAEEVKNIIDGATETPDSGLDSFETS